MNEGPERSPADERTLRLESQLAAVTARVFQLEQEVAALRGDSVPSVAALAPESATPVSPVSRREVPPPAFDGRESPVLPPSNADAPAASPVFETATATTASAAFCTHCLSCTSGMCSESSVTVASIFEVAASTVKLLSARTPCGTNNNRKKEKHICK